MRDICATSFVYALIVISFVFFHAPSAKADGSLPTSEIKSLQKFAVADGQFADGWKWAFDVTVPSDQTLIQMEFGDWSNGTTSIPAGGNTRIYSAQSTNAKNGSGAISIASSDDLSDILALDPGADLNPDQDGRQIEIIVEVKIPSGTIGGSYGTSYDIIATKAPQPLTFSITAQNRLYNGTNVATITNCSVIGAVDGHPVTCTATNGRFADIHVGSDKQVTADIAVSGDTTAYTFGSTGITTANIAPTPVIVSFTGKDKVFDGTTVDTNLANSINADYSNGGGTTGDALMVKSYDASFADSAVGSNKPVNVSNIALIVGYGNGNISDYTYNTTAMTTASISAGNQ